MALRSFTGFDSGIATSTSEYGVVNSGGWSIAQESTIKRLGDYSVKATGTGSTGYCYVRPYLWNTTTGVYEQPTSSSTTWYNRFFLYVSSALSAESTIWGATQTWVTSPLHCYLTLTAAGNLKLYNATGSLVATSTTALATSRWYLIDLKTQIADSGAYELKLNGTSEFSGSGADLLNAAGSTVVFLFGKLDDSTATGTLYFDDWFCDDSTAPTATASVLLNVNSDAPTYTAWTNDYTSVDEIPPDTSDAITTSTSGNAETVNFESASSAGVVSDIDAVESIVLVRKTASQTASVKHRRRTASTDYDLSAYTFATQYTWYLLGKVDETNPNTSSAWTTSQVDAFEVGVVANASRAMACAWIGANVALNYPLGNITQNADSCDQAAEGTVSSGFSGTITQSAAAATQTAEGRTLWGTAVQNAAPCTQTASGTQLVSGSIAQNAAAATQAAQGTCFWATVSQTAAACVQTATGAEIYSSTAAQLTAACTQEATGAEIYSGTSAQNAAACVQAAAGAEIYSGTIDQNAAAAYQAAEGTAQLDITGEAAQTTAAAVQSAAAELIFSATITQNVDAAEQALDGAVIANIGAITQSAQPSAQELSGALIFSASITQQTAAAVQAATGTQPVTATAEQQTAAATQELSGMVANHIGTAAQTAAAATQAATAALIFSATATQTTAACFQSADGAEIYSATATQTATACTQAATAQVVANIGQITQTAQPSQQAAAATLIFEGSIAQTATATSQLLAGEMPISASVAQTAAPAQQAATGEVLLLEGAITQVTTACIQSADALTYFSYVTGTSAQQSAAAQQLAAGALVAIGELIQQLSACTQTLSAVNDAAIRNISMSGSFITADTASATFLDASLSGSMINTTTFTGTV